MAARALQNMARWEIHKSNVQPTALKTTGKRLSLRMGAGIKASIIM